MNDIIKSIIGNPEHYTTQPVAVVVTGVPGSGKTTALKQIFGEELYNRHVVSSDHYIETEAAKMGKTYTEAFSELIADANAHLLVKMKELKNKGQLIIWDQTNLTPKKRKVIVNRLKDTHHLVLMVFDVPEDIVEQRVADRADKTGKIIPDHIQASMRKNFDPSADMENSFSDIWYWSKENETFKPKYEGQYID